MSIVKAVAPNQRAIEALAPRAIDYEISVVEHRGLVVSVRPTGEKRFVYRRREDGRLRRSALHATDLRSAVCEWGALRRDARACADIRSGRGEQPEVTRPRRSGDRRDPTVAQLIGRLMNEQAEPDKRSWRSDYNRLVKYVLPAWGHVRARELRRGDVHALLQGIARKRPLQANRILAAIRKLFAFAADAGVLEAHACLACPVTHCVLSVHATGETAADSAECARDRRPGGTARG